MTPLGAVNPPSAIVLNVTAVASPASPPSFLTAYPGGATRPLASDLNYGGGQTIPNLVVVGVGPDGTIQLYNNLGTNDVVADVMGWYG